MKARVLLWILPLIAFLVFAVFLMTRLGKDPAVLPSARLGKPFPTFNAASLTESKKISLDNIKGQVALVNVWASWCPSCKQEHPTLTKLAQQGVTIFGLNYKDKIPEALDYLARYGNPFSLIFTDPKGDIGLDLGVTGAPEIFILDKDANIRYHFAGVLDESTWQTQLAPCYQQLLAGVEAKACQ
ncbi:MAG: DsbE family thiol:disulfide interchange protein [Agitococcus sp.]